MNTNGVRNKDQYFLQRQLKKSAKLLFKSHQKSQTYFLSYPFKVKMSPGQNFLVVLLSFLFACERNFWQSNYNSFVCDQVDFSLSSGVDSSLCSVQQHRKHS